MAKLTLRRTRSNEWKVVSYGLKLEWKPTIEDVHLFMLAQARWNWTIEQDLARPLFAHQDSNDD